MTLTGLALCYVWLNSSNSLSIVCTIHKTFKNMQHKCNLWFADVCAHTRRHTHTHSHTHTHTPPPTHQSVHSAGTNSNRLQRDCRPELWALGRVVIEKQWQWFQQQNPCSLSGFITVLRKYRCCQKLIFWPMTQNGCVRSKNVNNYGCI